MSTKDKKPKCECKGEGWVPGISGKPSKEFIPPWDQSGTANSMPCPGCQGGS